uniref:Chemokine interleukin-8-like domain-containing protein n=2 Tax=Cyprinodon variegatus TaxID=28743 RepID=A0A3Q2E5X1_CYPVA
MLNFNSLFRSALVAMVLVVASGDPGEKLATCCTKVTNTEIKEPILDFLIQKANGQCVNAVIFQTETGLYCSHIRAPWVKRKIQKFRGTKGQQNILSPPTVSLLSIITSTTSPPSSSTLPRSFSSPFLTSVSAMTSGDMPSGEMPSGEMPSGDVSSGDVPSGDVSSGDMSSGDMSSGSVEDKTI